MRALNLSQPVCAGIDIGNGFVNIVSSVSQPITFQSTAAPLATLGDSLQGDAKQPVMVDSVPWVVGLPPRLIKHAQAIHKGGHFSDEHYALFLEAISRIGVDIDVLVVGMTVDQASDRANVAKLKEKLKGAHPVGGGEIFIDRVGVYPQPRGTARLFLEGLLENFADQTFLVIDIGEGTTDVNRLDAAIDDDGEIQVVADRESAMAEWIGVSKISEKVASALDGKVSPADVSRALWKEQSVISAGGQEFDLAGMVEEAAKQTSAALATAIHSKVKSLDAVDVVLLTGGGAHVLGHHIAGRLGVNNAKIMPDAAMANARGFYLLAQDCLAANHG